MGLSIWQVLIAFGALLALPIGLIWLWVSSIRAKRRSAAAQERIAAELARKNDECIG